MNMQLIYPMAFMVFYIFACACFLLLNRKKAISQKKVHPRYFKVLQMDGPVDEQLLAVTNHFNNQFQVPPLYLFTLLVLHTLSITTTFTVALAWLFILTRAAHSFVFLTYNNPLHRFIPYVCGWIILLILWVRIIS